MCDEQLDDVDGLFAASRAEGEVHKAGLQPEAPELVVGQPPGDLAMRALRTAAPHRSALSCPCCFGVGWVLEYAGGGAHVPLTLELLPCFYPECPSSGRPIERISLHPLTQLRVATPHPATGVLMAVGR